MLAALGLNLLGCLLDSGALLAKVHILTTRRKNAALTRHVGQGLGWDELGLVDAREAIRLADEAVAEALLRVRLFLRLELVVRFVRKACLLLVYSHRRKEALPWLFDRYSRVPLDLWL